MQTDNPKSENIISVNNIHFSFKSVKYSIISNISQPNIFQTFLWFEANLEWDRVKLLVDDFQEVDGHVQVVAAEGAGPAESATSSV